MSDIGEAAEFPLETRDVGRARPEQGLERDRLVANAVVHCVDDAHATSTELAKDPESLRAAKLGLDLIRPVRAPDWRGPLVQHQQAASVGHCRPREKARRAFVRPHQALDLLAQFRIPTAGVDEERMAAFHGALDGALKDVVDSLPAIRIHLAPTAAAQGPPPASAS